MLKEIIPDVLAHRYATKEMVDIWSPTGRVVFERRLWVAVLMAHKELGVNIPDGAIEAYKAVVDQVDLASIEAREVKFRHDVNARMREFNELAGFEAIHLGMTSRDPTDNVEGWQIYQSLRLVHYRMITVLARMMEKAKEYESLAMTGRSHNMPGQVTTFGKRIATYGEETLHGFWRLEHVLQNYALRGIKGPMGTAQDQLYLLGGDTEKLARLEAKVAQFLGVKNVLGCVGQIYPRSYDYDVVSALALAAAGPSNLATTFRLMAGFGLLTEGFQSTQIGSSAMPHKANARTCERANAFYVLLQGFASMLGNIAGHQWQEGDVSCSVVRRVALPSAFFALDGLIEAILTVLDEFGVFPIMIERELEQHFSFLATTTILGESVTRGAGRDTAYAAIQEHAKALAQAAQSEGGRIDFFARLGGDERIPMNKAEIVALVGEPLDFIGDARGQVSRFCDLVKPIVEGNPEAAAYKPSPIL